MDSVQGNSDTSYHHSTWARTFHSWPELFLEPESIVDVQKIVQIAHTRRRRVVVVGSAHSPSDLTCTSSWLISLRKLSNVHSIDPLPNGDALVHVEAGISLMELNEKLNTGNLNLMLPNMGSIDIQSLAGAMATATHGSSLQHGLLSQNVTRLRLVLADGSLIWCSADERPDLFRAALVSLGALGVMVEVEYRAVPTRNIEWHTKSISLHEAVSSWNSDLWNKAEFVRVWWFPYTKQMIHWTGNKTDKSPKPPARTFLGSSLGFYAYKIFLYISNYVPAILPLVERVMFGLQYRFGPGSVDSAVEDQRTGLLMNCLYSQFVDEWALPLSKGPEVLTRLSEWLNSQGRPNTAGIPFSSKDLYVHAPIEVRISNGSESHNSPRGFLDPTCSDEATLYLNATLYRVFGKDPPCKERYYEAFEWLMRQYNGRPHWAKSFQTVTNRYLRQVYGRQLDEWLSVRSQVDPYGVFLGPWHRRLLLGNGTPVLPLEETELRRWKLRDGGLGWQGTTSASVPTAAISSSGNLPSRKSEESFESLGASTECGEILSTP